MHKNARLTPKGREVMLGRLQAGQHQVDVAQAMGVSLTTLKKWWRRYRSAGLAGLLDRSSRPARSPRQLSSSVGAQIKIRHLRTQPYTPRTNGKAERFIQTCLREWAYAEAYTTSAQRTMALAHWLHHYNWHRPHTALKSTPPISRLNLDGSNLLRLHS